MVKIVKGDWVTHPDWPELGVGRAAQIELGQRWVAWTNLAGHWAAAAYKPAELVFVGPPAAAQIRLLIDGS